jgi:Fic family protein
MYLNEIDSLSAKLSSLRPLNPGEIKRLREEFVIQNTYDSNAIEGNSLTLRETMFIIKVGVAIGGKPAKDELATYMHGEALQYIFNEADKKTPLSMRFIEIIHYPPQLHLVSPQLEQLIAEYEKSEKHIIEAVSDFHLRFEAIHPFIDGNGRTGRLILNLELIKAGLLPVNIKYSDKKRYYECFDSDNAEMLTNLIAELEIAELKRYIAMLE